jgi:hypothetical protein
MEVVTFLIEKSPQLIALIATIAGLFAGLGAYYKGKADYLDAKTKREKQKRDFVIDDEYRLEIDRNAEKKKAIF